MQSTIPQLIIRYAFLFSILLLTSIAQADDAHPSTSCKMPGLGSAELTVFAVDEYGGRELAWQIDQSGSQATQIDVEVNLPGKSIALVLRGYEPTIWNIGYTTGTTILGVSAYGYHRQVITGLPASTPRLISAVEEDDRCGRTAKGKKQNLNQIATEVFGAALYRRVRAKDSVAIVGPPRDPGSELIRSSDSTPESYFDKTIPLAGAAALAEAVRKGILRSANEAELAAWDWLSDANGSPARRGQAYVVLTEFNFPEGTGGEVFLVPVGAPMPKGNRGGSTVLDARSNTCSGPDPLCGGTPWRNE